MALRLFNWPTYDLFDPSDLACHNHTQSSPTTNLGAVDIVEKEDEFLIVADTPGMKNEDVKVEVKDNYITLSGERKEEHRVESKDHTSYRMERSFGKFSRSFRLPATADASKIRASCEHGVLKVTLPKKTPEAAQGVSVNISDKHD